MRQIFITTAKIWPVNNSLLILFFYCFIWNTTFAQAVYVTPSDKRYPVQHDNAVHHSPKTTDSKRTQKRSYDVGESGILQTPAIVKTKSEIKLESDKIFCTARTSNGTKCLNTIHASLKFCDEHITVELYRKS